MLFTTIAVTSGILGGIASWGLTDDMKLDPLKSTSEFSGTYDLFSKKELPNPNSWSTATKWCGFDFAKFLEKKLVEWYKIQGFPADFEGKTFSKKNYKKFFSIPKTNYSMRDEKFAKLLDPIRLELIKEAEKEKPNMSLDFWLGKIDAIVSKAHPDYLSGASVKNLRDKAKAYKDYLYGVSMMSANLRGQFAYIDDYINLARSTIRDHCGTWEKWSWSDEITRIREVDANFKNNINPAMTTLVEKLGENGLGARINYVDNFLIRLNDALADKAHLFYSIFDGMKTSALYEGFKNEIDALHVFYKDELKTQNDAHIKQIKDLQTAHTAEMKKMKDAYELTIKGLNETIEKYKVALDKSTNLLKQYGSKLDAYSQAEIDRLVKEKIALAQDASAGVAATEALAKKTFGVDPALYNTMTSEQMLKGVDAKRKKGVMEAKATLDKEAKEQKEKADALKKNVMMGVGALTAVGVAAVAFNNKNQVTSKKKKKKA